jgi:uncharacterized protein YrrD
MTSPQDAQQQYLCHVAVDAEGNRIGKITKVYLDDQTGQPLWVLVETGLFRHPAELRDCCQAAGQRLSRSGNAGMSAQHTDRNGRSWTMCLLLRIKRSGRFTSR